jgi:hypothetical protein
MAISNLSSLNIIFRFNGVGNLLSKDYNKYITNLLLVKRLMASSGRDGVGLRVKRLNLICAIFCKCYRAVS